MKDELIENLDYIIRPIKMPEGTHGLIMMDEEDRANIYVNNMDTHQIQKQAADHEIRHYAFDDLYLPEDVAEKVNRAREKSVRIEVVDTADEQADNILRIII